MEIIVLCTITDKNRRKVILQVFLLWLRITQRLIFSILYFCKFDVCNSSFLTEVNGTTIMLIWSYSYPHIAFNKVIMSELSIIKVDHLRKE